MTKSLNICGGESDIFEQGLGGSDDEMSHDVCANSSWSHRVYIRQHSSHRSQVAFTANALLYALLHRRYWFINLTIDNSTILCDDMKKDIHWIDIRQVMSWDKLFLILSLATLNGH
jgi:hypothetical protein